MIPGPDLNIFDQLHLAIKINIIYIKFSTTKFHYTDFLTAIGCIKATKRQAHRNSRAVKQSLVLMPVGAVPEVP